MTKPPHSADSILRTVGRTPLVRLGAFERPGGPKIYAKCEYLGPAGSIFDRAAVAVVLEGQLGGHLTPGRAIVTAGGTDASVSLAMAASAVGHPAIIIVPKGMLPERKRLLVDYGAKLETVDNSLGYDGAWARAAERAKETGGVLVDLFAGQDIVRAYEQIGLELIEALGTPPNVVVCGLDLGTIPTGLARGVWGAKVVAVEPEAARIATGGPFGAHLMLGLAPAPDPIALDRGLVRDFEAVSDRDAWAMSERLAKESGVLAGLASGAILVAALRRSETLGPEAKVVVVLPDSGERRFMLSAYFQ